jgi:hypothetical protein
MPGLWEDGKGTVQEMRKRGRQLHETLRIQMSSVQLCLLRTMFSQDRDTSQEASMSRMRRRDESVTKGDLTDGSQ